MAFTGPVVVEELDHPDAGSRWLLRDHLIYDGKRERFVVPVGFTTDFASVPQWLTWLIPRYGRYTKAAILHDFLWSECRRGAFDWADADGILRRVMRELGVPFLRRWLMWAAVRLASIVGHEPSSLWKQGWVPAVQLVAVTVPGVLFLATPGAVVLVFLLAYGVLESVVFAPLVVASKRPRGGGKRVNRPRLTLPR